MTSKELTPEIKKELSERMAKKKAEEKEAAEKAVEETTDTQPQVNLDEELDKQDASEQAEAIKKAMAMIMKNPAAFLQAYGDLEASGGSPVIKKVEKCHRHPDIDVKPGENCPECIAQSKHDEQIRRNREYVLACPKCGESKHKDQGGTVWILTKKPGHYACGFCKISYNVAGECVEWGHKDAHFYGEI